MPKPNDEENEITDPIILAALIEDPDEDEDDKKLRAEMLGTDEDTDEDEDDDKPKGKKKPAAASEDEDDDEDSEDEDEAAAGKTKKPKKPIEAEDDSEEDEGDEEDEDEGKKPKSKRQTRKAFFDSIQKEGAAKRQPRQIPEYNPVDYGAAPDEGFKPEQLKQDRDQFGNIQFVKGAETVQFWADQDKFWSDLTGEAKLLSYDPDLAFLSTTKPDGTKNPDFDEDKASEINEMYLQLAGFKQFYKTNDKGETLYDPTTRQPLVVSTVDRTDLSYEKFAKRYVRNMKTWADDFADDRVEENTKKVTSQRKKQGMRPGGGSRRTLGALNPGDISKMSDEDFEKNEAEIDRQIAAML